MAGGRRRARRAGRLRAGPGAPGAGRRLRLAGVDGARAARARHRRGGAGAAARRLLGRRAHAGVAGARPGVASGRAAAGRAHQPPRHRGGGVARADHRRARRGRAAGLARPVAPGVAGDRRPRDRPRAASKLWPMGYSAFRRERALAIDRQGAEAERQAAEIARLERFVDPLARRHQVAAGGLAPEEARQDGAPAGAARASRTWRSGSRKVGAQRPAWCWRATGWTSRCRAGRW